MANGRFSRGITQVLADASLVFVGNLNHSVETLVQHPDMDLFQPLPKELDLALIDRFHFYLPGWEVPKNSNSLLTTRYGFVSDYLSEAFRALRKENRYDWAEQHVRFGPDVEGRDATAARKAVSGFLKLLHPDGTVTPEEVREYVELALEARRRVKEQLKKRGPFEFSKVDFTYVDLADGAERRVDVPEDRRVSGEPQPAPPTAAPTPERGAPAPTSTGDRAGAASPVKERYEVGDWIDGQHEVVGYLGFGGFSRVYRIRAIDRREYALKIFHTDDPDATVREIEVLRSISHPNVVKAVWGGRLTDGRWFLVTELVQGETLEAYANGDKRMAVPEAVRVGVELLSALETIHPDPERVAALVRMMREGEVTEEEYEEWMALKARDVVHRDIKPQNLILTPEGNVVLIDFGIASHVGSRVLTNRGTPAYQSPDIRPGVEEWDVSPDLFAVGVLLYELICNKHPYEGGSPRVDLQPRDPRLLRPELGDGLAQFLVKACAPYREHRFATARETRLALEAAGADDNVSEWPVSGLL